jgi:hypothetical protein
VARHGLLFTAILLAWLVGVVSWLVAVLEWVLVWRFVPLAYDAGWRVFDEPADLALPTRPLGAVGETDSGRFKLVSPRQCLFRPAFRMFEVGIHTPFAIKGAVRWEAQGARVVGRLPVGTTGFFLAWVTGWTSGGLLIAGVQPAIGVPFMLLGWLFAGLLVGFSLKYERRRARRILGEVAETLSRGSAPRRVGPASESR